MLKDEARWLGSVLAGLDDAELFPLVDVGSSTEEVRVVHQPWIDELVFAPLRRRGRILHQDLKARPGVDIVGDLAEPSVQSELRRIGVRSVLCTNVLEHVPTDRRAAACTAMADLVPPGGHLLVTVPRAFPYHPDPIDTGFRPDVAELAALFPSLRMDRGEVVRCSTVWGLLEKNLFRLAGKSLRLIIGSKDREISAAPAGSLRQWLIPWAWRPFEMTCTLLTRSR